MRQVDPTLVLLELNERRICLVEGVLYSDPIDQLGAICEVEHVVAQHVLLKECDFSWGFLPGAHLIPPKRMNTCCAWHPVSLNKGDATS